MPTTQNITSRVCKFQANWTQRNKDTKLLIECTHHRNRNSISLVWWAPKEDPCFMYLPLQEIQTSCFSPGFNFFVFKFYISWILKESLHSKEGLFHTDYQQNLSLHNLHSSYLDWKHHLWILIAHAWNSVVSHRESGGAGRREQTLLIATAAFIAKSEGEIGK